MGVLGILAEPNEFTGWQLKLIHLFKEYSNFCKSIEPLNKNSSIGYTK